MLKEYEIDKVLELAKASKNINVKIEEYNVGDDRSSYFNAVDNIYEDMMENVDDLEFIGDMVDVARSNSDYNHDSTLEAIFEVLSYVELDEVLGYDDIQEEIDSHNENDDEDEILDDLADMTLQEVKNKYPEFYENVIETLDEITDENLDVRNDGGIVFDCNYIEEVINTATYDALAYWTRYFSPDYDDAEVAIHVGLVPFKYDGTFYLALGGCGMDLSPRLDAYVALTYHVIPKNSGFFREDDYFKYVVGETVYNEIIEKCKLSSKKYIIEFTENTKED